MVDETFCNDFWKSVIRPKSGGESNQPLISLFFCCCLYFGMFRTAVVLKSKVQNGKRLIDSVTSICELKRVRGN